MADPQWKANFAKRKPSVKPEPVTPPVNPDKPVTKNGKTCGNPVCCMRVGGRAEVTYEAPTVLDASGMDRGGYTFRAIEPPMLCGGVAWMPKRLSKWEQQRREAKAAPGLNDFRKKK